MLNKDQIQALRAPFPPEALRADTSRGFELTSIKAAYVFERLNEVLGPCGIGWRYAHSPFEGLPTSSGVEIVTEVAFQYRCGSEHTGTGPTIWDARANNWTVRTRDLSVDWSEPIFASGGRSVGKGSAAFTDARKGAVTDGLTKAASMLGIGHEVFKGLVRAEGGSKPAPTAERVRGNGGNGKKPARADAGDDKQPSSTDFWTLYRTTGEKVPLDVVKALAAKGDWPVACDELNTLIAAS